MRIRPNKPAVEALYTKLKTAILSEEREGTHVSDLLQIRQAYWKRVCPLPPNDDEVGFWLAGKAHHYFLVQAVTGINDSQEASLIDIETGIHYSPDLLELKGEFKTSRWAILPTTEEQAIKAVSTYIPQCRAYAALMNTLNWNLYVFYLTALDFKTRRKIPRLKAYTFEFTNEELQEERDGLRIRSALLDTAVRELVFESLPLCSEFLCFRMQGHGRGRKRTVEGVCKWWEQCKPAGRYNT